ncbi:MAG: BolA/IbaG family iron-sulfur metabolism protein [Alphaproteobacteria bacterium]|jgi:stress-induced morphogen|nr:BolA/IbaG family iron-sulfur metabolism protein [Alphaproteobacteria bacterium]
MAISSSDLELLIRAAFPKATFTLVDTLGDQDHYHLSITCASFCGKTRVAQHQMVYGALQGLVGGQLHALSLKTTPLTQE